MLRNGRSRWAETRKNGVRYELHAHPEAYTAQEVAAVGHVPGRQFAKVVIADADGKFVMLVSSPWGLDRVDAAAVARFAELARARLPEIDAADAARILQNLGLTRDGRLTNASVLLFANRPRELFPHAQARIGVFKGTEIVDSHDFGETLWQQLDGAMERFRSDSRMTSSRSGIPAGSRRASGCTSSAPRTTLRSRGTRCSPGPSNSPA